MTVFKRLLTSLGSLASCLFPMLAFADAPVVKTDTGDTAWVLASTALVMLMTPGLAFFYAGMTRAKNVSSTLFQNYSAIAVVGLVWTICGYSLAFSGNFAGLFGNLDHAMLMNVGQEPNAAFSATVPHIVFMAFQCMFAVIAPALMTGAFAERVRFSSWLMLMAVWSLVVYTPVAHWVWGVDGWIKKDGGLDFAGGLVVHMTAGYSALAATLLIGRRQDFGIEHKPYDIGQIALGTGLLLFGWFGFNGGSALGANGLAGHAVVTSFVAAAASYVSWMAYDWYAKGKPSFMGACIGAIAGLVAITPAAGFVTVSGALAIGLITGAFCNYMAVLLKERFKLDDTLDVFACHGMGGTLGTILTGVLATKAVNPAGADGLIFGGVDVFRANLVGGVAVAVFSFVATVVIYKVINAVMPMRVSEHDERAGLDVTQHGEVINSELPSARDGDGHLSVVKGTAA